MALTPAQQTAARALIAQEGIRNLIQQLQELSVDKVRNDALNSLLTAIVATVPDWPAFRSALSALKDREMPTTLDALIRAIDTAIAAGDASKLGALLAAQHVAITEHFGSTASAGARS